MVEVMVGVDEIADRLPARPLCDFPDHGERTLLALRRFDDGDVVGELDGDAVVAAARQIEHAGRDFLRTAR